MKNSLPAWLVLAVALLVDACSGNSTPRYAIFGSISGLNGGGLVLRNNGESLTVPSGAYSYQFTGAASAGGSYDVTVAAQPAGLVCTVSNGSGSDVQIPVFVPISCSASVYIAGTVSGLSAAGLVLENDHSRLPVSPAASAFQFPDPVTIGGSYNVTIAQQPAGLTCTVVHGAGSGVQATVSTVSVSCSAVTYAVSGTLSGLTANGLVLRDNGADDLTVPANATTFKFRTGIASGGAYAVTSPAQPAGLTCTVSGGTGTRINSNIDSVHVTCSPTALSVGGTVTGLTAAGLVLQNNATDDLTVSVGATTFQFPTAIAYHSAYAVTVLAQPPGQSCSVAHGASTATADVNAIAVTCTNIATFSVSASSGANGSVSPAGTTTINEGGSASFVAIPDPGYGVYQWSLDGTVVQNGGALYTLSNVLANHSVQVTFASATLTPSLSTLALSVDDTALNAALTGTARQVIISNTGSIAATNLSVLFPTWPTGTSASSSCGGTLAAGASCSITVTPGANATSSCTSSATAPTPDIVTLSSDESGPSSFSVVVLGYACIYQGGNVFAIDDATPATASVGGKVAAPTDQALAFPSGVDWSPGGDFFQIVGIDETASSPCAGSTAGACNSAQIVAHYSAASPALYAAGLCLQTIGAFSDWYLPSICEMGYDGASSGSGCGSSSSPLIQNMQSNLVGLGNFPAGYFWSSTEFSANPALYAWVQDFTGGGSFQSSPGKDNLVGVRCVRALTP